MPVSGGELELVTEESTRADVRSPDGKKIYFIKEGNIWEVPAEGDDERQITDLSGKYGSLIQKNLVAADKQYLYFLWDEDSGDIWITDVEWE